MGIVLSISCSYRNLICTEALHGTGICNFIVGCVQVVHVNWLNGTGAGSRGRVVHCPQLSRISSNCVCDLLENRPEITVPTLPVTGWAAPLYLFRLMDYFGEEVAYSLLIVIGLVALFYYLCVFVAWCFRIRRPYLCQRRNQLLEDNIAGFDDSCLSRRVKGCWESFKGNCCKRFTDKCHSLLLLLARKLNVITFPGLFKELKVRHENRPGTRKFMVLLDRNVEDNCKLIFAFYLMALSIFATALLAFSRYIPVNINGQCLEQDDLLRDLFCYTSESTWPTDCDAYNDNELDDINFVCYTISLLDLGLAVAAALGLAKLAEMGISLYIKR